MAQEQLKPRHPLAEVFGFKTTDRSAEAKRHRKGRLCPYNNIVAQCTKDKIVKQKLRGSSKKIPRWQREEADIARKICADSEDRYIRVPRCPWTPSVKQLLKFRKTVEDVKLRITLWDAIHNDNPVGAIDRLFTDFGEVSSQWFQYRFEHNKVLVSEWLREINPRGVSLYICEEDEREH